MRDGPASIVCLVSPLMMKQLFLSLLGVGAVFSAPFGQQISESGIRHSFLITGTKTAIVSEDSEIIWEVPQRSRDGEVSAKWQCSRCFWKRGEGIHAG